MTDHTKPTSEWEHSHALEAGDVVVDDDLLAGRVQSVAGNGSVVIEWDDGVTETYTEKQITDALSSDVLERDDGLSHELASY